MSTTTNEVNRDKQEQKRIVHSSEFTAEALQLAEKMEVTATVRYPCSTFGVRPRRKNPCQYTSMGKI
ncbi:hypothetical protein AB4454_02860 [Vibrio artabrorum]|uniref:hypothetical protein n=1 Tax=Vibrio artabrorum TaxID=446374 RepID=UPI0035521B1B